MAMMIVMVMKVLLMMAMIVASAVLLARACKGPYALIPALCSNDVIKTEKSLADRNYCGKFTLTIDEGERGQRGGSFPSGNHRVVKTCGGRRAAHMELL